MISMTLGARGCIGGISLQSSAMDSSVKFFVCHIVADPTVNSFQLFRMRKILDICILMTINAVHTLMN
jgi:hypothetical protein